MSNRKAHTKNSRKTSSRRRRPVAEDSAPAPHQVARGFGVTGKFPTPDEEDQA